MKLKKLVEKCVEDYEKVINELDSIYLDVQKWIKVLNLQHQMRFNNDEELTSGILEKFVKEMKGNKANIIAAVHAEDSFTIELDNLLKNAINGGIDSIIDDPLVMINAELDCLDEEDKEKWRLIQIRLKGHKSLDGDEIEVPSELLKEMEELKLVIKDKYVSEEIKKIKDTIGIGEKWGEVKKKSEKIGENLDDIMRFVKRKELKKRLVELQVMLKEERSYLYAFSHPIKYVVNLASSFYWGDTEKQHIKEIDELLERLDYILKRVSDERILETTKDSSTSLEDDIKKCELSMDLLKNKGRKLFDSRASRIEKELKSTDVLEDEETKEVLEDIDFAAMLEDMDELDEVDENFDKRSAEENLSPAVDASDIEDPKSSEKTDDEGKSFKI